MTLHLGYVAANSTLYIPFHTFGADGASITLTGLAVTDIEIYKNGSVTQRASDAGYALLDTDGIDFDGITGIHGFSIDLSDNTTAGFYSDGAFYWVVISAVTIDGNTVNFIAATFFIGDLATAAAVAAIPDGVWDEVVDGATTARESIALQNSALFGEVSGAGTGTETFRDLADSKDRIEVTVDGSGNRTAVTLDGS